MPLEREMVTLMLSWDPHGSVHLADTPSSLGSISTDCSCDGASEQGTVFARETSNRACGGFGACTGGSTQHSAGKQADAH